MKNLTVTLGLILLMSMGILHDADSLHVMRTHLQLRSICSEMAAGAADILAGGGNLEDAEAYAADILQRNREGSMEWELEIVGNTITVKVRTDEMSLTGPASGSPLHLTYQITRKLVS